MADKTCVSCKHFIGGGDWNLCCDLMYELCYRNTPACDKYEFSQESINAALQQDMLARTMDIRFGCANAIVERYEK